MQLEHLLNKCRQNNGSAGVTGMLLYKHGNFMQCLEGPKDADQTLEAKIRSDQGNRGMIVLLNEDDVHLNSENGRWDLKNLILIRRSKCPVTANF